MRIEVQLGTTPADNATRDAVHVAVAPVVAGETLQPGQRVDITVSGKCRFAFAREPHIGIVDPFLTAPVERGERFYLCLYPGTVTSLRHMWTHPAFAVKVPSEVPS